MRKLLILSSNTGEGHNSAAAAIQSSARAAGLEPSIRKPLEESGTFNRTLGSVYNSLLTRRPQWMSSYLRFIDFFRPNDREYLYRCFQGFMTRFIDSERPDAVLSVHPMLNHFIPRFLKERRSGIPAYAFLTDPFPPFWRGWASPYIDRYFVVRDEALQALTKMGVTRSRIERVEMPVRTQFNRATMTEIQAFRRELAINDSPMVLINGGARGGGPIRRVYDTVRRAAPSWNVVVICGRNVPMRYQIDRLNHAHTRTVGFVADIHRFIAASDLVLTKPGAMSTYEALACGVPPVLLGILALMPQESGMFEAATRYGFGYSVGTFAELENIIRLGPHEWNRKREAVGAFYRRTSGEELIQRIQPAHATA